MATYGSGTRFTGKVDNPKLIAKAMLKDKTFTQAPPEVQQAIREIAETGKTTTPWPDLFKSARESGVNYENSPWWAGLVAMGAAAVGGAALSHAFAGASSVAGGVLPSTSTVGTAALPSAAGSSLTAAGGSAAAATGAGVTGAASGVSAAATGAGLWGKLAANPVITAAGIGAGAGLAGTWMQTRAAKQAAEIEAESARQALQWQKEQYGVRQRQLAPAIGSGSAATYKLDELMGLKVPEGGYQAPPETQPGYQAPPEQSMPRGTPPQRNPNAPQTPPTVDMVQVTSPKGQPGWIPRSNLDAALRAGATQVG